jgi:hypothetical protein
MSRNSHGRKPKANRPLEDDQGRRPRNVHRAYRRSRDAEWQHGLEDEEVEELEDFDALSDIEDNELDALEEFIEPDEEDQN